MTRAIGFRMFANPNVPDANVKAAEGVYESEATAMAALGKVASGYCSVRKPYKDQIWIYANGLREASFDPEGKKRVGTLAQCIMKSRR
jgi:uncharacterized membrane protein